MGNSEMTCPMLRSTKGSWDRDIVDQSWGEPQEEGAEWETKAEILRRPEFSSRGGDESRQ